jgi:uncharacterized membrane protein HdeD (DUF308 family)
MALLLEHKPLCEYFAWHFVSSKLFEKEKIMETTQVYLQQRFGNHWWHLLLLGTALVLLGLVLIFWPLKTAAVLITLVAIFLLVDGIIDVVNAMMNRDGGWSWRMAGGILGILAGIFLLLNPLAGALIAILFQYYVLSFVIIIKAFLRMIGGTRTANTIGNQWSWGNFFMGLLELLIGLFLLANPLLGVLSLLWIIALISIVGGIIVVLLSFRIKNMARSLA